jgi:hypothetical protein
LEAYQIASNSVELLYLGKYLADQDDKWTYLEDTGLGGKKQGKLYWYKEIFFGAKRR